MKGKGRLFDRGRILHVVLKKSIVLNDNVIKRAKIEIDHINYGLNKKTGKLNKKKRTNFTADDVEKFLNLLDGEYLYTDKHKGSLSRFVIRIDCPISYKFYGKEFILIFETDYNNTDEIHAITLYPGW